MTVNQRRGGEDRREEVREALRRAAGLTAAKARLDELLHELRGLVDDMAHVKPAAVNPVYWRQRLTDIVQRARDD